MSIHTERTLAALQPDIGQTDPQGPGKPSVPIYPLQNGDHLTRAEFERRYSAMPQIKNAELIEGVVYVNSPVSENHGIPQADLLGWFATYRAFTPGVILADNTTVRLDEDNEPSA